MPAHTPLMTQGSPRASNANAHEDNKLSEPPLKAHYIFGAGPDLVLLHSGTTTWHIWVPLLPLLTPHFRVIIIPLAGYPNGSPIDQHEEVSLSLLVDRITGELNALNIKSAHFAGIGLGGTIALELAERKRALSLSLFSPAGGWWRKDDISRINIPLNQLSQKLPLIKLFVYPFLFLPLLRRKILRKFMINGQRVPAKDIKQLINNVCTNPMPKKLLASLELGREFRQIPNPNIPISVIWPEKDLLYPLETHSRFLILTIPYAELKYLPNAGHIPIYDQPELVAKHIVQTICATSNEHTDNYKQVFSL